MDNPVPYRKLKYALEGVLRVKQDIVPEINSLQGAYINGEPTVTVPGREDYVYVRLRGSDSEVVHAYNDSTLRSFNMPVSVRREGSRWVVVGKSRAAGGSGGYGGQFPLPNHGAQHSFSGGTGTTAGADPVWVYKRQFMPLQTHPTYPNSMRVEIAPDYYPWGSNYVWFAGTGTADLTPLIPDQANYGRFVTIYLEGDTGELSYVTGEQFLVTATVTDPGRLVPYPDPTDGVILSSTYLVNGMSELGWSNIWDMRNVVGSRGGFTADAVPSHNDLNGLQGGLSPSEFYHLTAAQYGSIGTGTYWSLVGNTDTDPIPTGTHQLGTLDDRDFALIRNNSQVARLFDSTYVPTTGQGLKVGLADIPDGADTFGGIALAGDSTTSGELNLYAVGSSNPNITGWKANGTTADPTTLLSGNYMWNLGAKGYDGSAWSGIQARIRMRASQDWTDAHHGTNIGLFVTPDDSTTIGEAATLSSVGLALANLTASTALYSDANKRIQSLANAAGWLYNNGAGALSWSTPTAANVGAWGLTGNAGTNPSTNFIGTTDAQDIVLKTNSTEVVRLSNTDGALLIGDSAHGLGAVGTTLGVVTIGAHRSICSVNYGSGNPAFAGFDANGTRSSPSVSLSGNVLARFSGFGYMTSGWASASNASVDLIADEDFGASSGTRIDFRTTPTGSATIGIHATLRRGQFDVLYDPSNYLRTSVSATGAVTLSATGGSAGFTFSQATTVAGALKTTDTTDATSTSTGALQSAGGLGVAKDVFVGSGLSVGENTLSPSTGTIRAKSSDSPYLYMESASTSAYTSASAMFINSQTADAMQRWYIGSQKNSGGAATGNAMFFIRRSDGTSWIDYLQINTADNNIYFNNSKSGVSAPASYGNVIVANGYFGVGTASPQKKLHVAGTILVGGDDGGYAGTVGLTNVSDASSNSTGVGSIKFKGTTSRDSYGFLKIYIGTTAVYVPFFTAITG